MNHLPAILTNLAPIEDFLTSAHRFGVPMPFDIGVTGHSGVRLIVHPDEMSAWVAYLEANVTDHVAESGATHRTIRDTVTFTDVPLSVVCIVPAEVTA